LGRRREKPPAFELEYVSAFAAPFIAEQLLPGATLNVVRRRAQTYVAFGSGADIVGMLPKTALIAARQAQTLGHAFSVQVYRLLKGEDGRHSLLVKLVSS
jgi:hypothetical protein